MQGPTQINDRISVAGQIEIGELADLAKTGFATIINNRPDREEPGQPDHATVEAAARKLGLEYRYVPITTGAITRKDVAAFQNALLRAPQPALAHCRSGTRSYILWALTRVLYDGEAPLELVAEAATKGYDLRVLSALVEKLEAEKGES